MLPDLLIIALLDIERIITGCQNNDTNCQTALVKAYAPVLMAVCKRYAPDHSLAYDALQDSFVNIFKYISNYKGNGSFEGWIKRIAVNCSLSYHKKKYKFSELNEYVSHPIVAPNIYAEMGERELLNILKQLPKGCYIVFNMYVVEGFSHREIAESLGISESSSRSQLKRARERLIDMLKDISEAERESLLVATNNLNITE